MRTLDRASGSALVVLGLFAAQQALVIGVGRPAEPGGGVMPLAIGLALVVTGLSIALAAGRRTGRPAWPASARRGPMLRVVGATISYFALVGWAGFLLSTALFLGYLFRAWGRYPWWLVALLTVVLAGGLYAVFDLWLRNPLPAGVWRDLR